MKTAFDSLLTLRGRNYRKSNNLSKLSDVALDAVIAAAERLPGPECEIFVVHSAPTRSLFHGQPQ
jgi:hypothetical protein